VRFSEAQYLLCSSSAQYNPTRLLPLPLLPVRLNKQEKICKASGTNSKCKCGSSGLVQFYKHCYFAYLALGLVRIEEFHPYYWGLVYKCNSAISYRCMLGIFGVFFLYKFLIWLSRHIGIRLPIAKQGFEPDSVVHINALSSAKAVQTANRVANAARLPWSLTHHCPSALTAKVIPPHLRHC